MPPNSPSCEAQNIANPSLQLKQQSAPGGLVSPLNKLFQEWQIMGEQGGKFPEFLSSKGYGINAACAAKLGPDFKDASKFVPATEFAKATAKSFDLDQFPGDPDKWARDAVVEAEAGRQLVETIRDQHIATRFFGALQTIAGGNEIVVGGFTKGAGEGAQALGAGPAIYEAGQAIVDDGESHARAGTQAFVHGVTSEKTEDFSNRFLGTLQVIGGGVEALAGAGMVQTGVAITGTGVVTTPVFGIGIPAVVGGPAVAVAGVAVGADGVDNVRAGWKAVASGKPSEPTVVQHAVHAGVLEASGSERLATVAEVGVALATPMGGGAAVVGQVGRARRLNDTERELAQSQGELASAKAELEETKGALARSDAELHVDPLTQIANRLAFNQDGLKLLNQAKNGEVNVHVMMIDIDHFKKVNDTYGHNFGDRVLKDVAGALKQPKERRAGWANESDATEFANAYRLGGEEFAILVATEKSAHGSEAALSLAEKVRQNVAELSIPYRSEKPGEALTMVQPKVSVGVAAFKGDETLENLLERADKALYVSKEGGRNRVTEAP